MAIKGAASTPRGPEITGAMGLSKYQGGSTPKPLVNTHPVL